jgi:LPS sulfotransferase NodH
MSTPDYTLFSSHLKPYERELEKLFSGICRESGGSAALPFGPLPEKSYLICFINRSGSTLLAEALTRTGRMGRPGEIFNPEPIANLSRRNGLRSLGDYVDWQFRTNTLGGVFGAKAGLHQIAVLAKQGLLARFPNPGFVFVTRRDLVMQAVSLNIAWQTGAWTSRTGAGKEPVFEHAAIARTLRSIVETQAGFEAFFAAHGITPLRLDYELIESEPERAMRRVCRLVGIERPMRVPLPPLTLQRQRTALNYDWAERFRALYGPGFASSEEPASLLETSPGKP